MVWLLLGSLMAEEGQDLGKVLMQIGGVMTIIPFWTEMVEELWFLFIIGPIIFITGAVIKAGQSNQSWKQVATQGLTPHLPTSKGVDVLEKLAGFADNPDTAVMSIGAQPEGTHPTMLGISATEFTSEAETYSMGSNVGDFSSTLETYTRSSNRDDFNSDEYNEFAEHGHERVLPLGLANPVSHWSNPVDEWQNPTKYW